MPEIKQYDFKYKEVAEALVKQAGLHEGRWQIVMSFGLGAANMGPTPDETVPGAAVAVTGIGLIRAAETSPNALVVNAAEVNPVST
ncbi:MAG: hypothetical protein E5W81_04345 [Mesorhizobium sp.]|uniref:hypothetical protein n=1 Tax=Mesorhizobium sp. TaxID=1871066 RepID=UPI00120BE8CA|nr:hypothetical protein [Mesorhizobium sp.]TIT22185.1 MAG: hypothetical protein E5W70_13790 [Mesorhizobium sp.]TIX46061.1 MAG: hypothetical protein E5V36_03120 [Mesorhizobium sp.]TKB31862.1 MAG: hypothetical protein E5W69_01010 [Mesorhizobium sp.]TKB96167.1 MAG: hypothetical protein E5W81_04345 [Mesorhizobium sp.]